MTSTFVWPCVGDTNREKKPEELTEDELRAWKAASYYPMRFPRVSQGDNLSSTIMHSAGTLTTKPSPLSNRWAAAQQAFDAKTSSSQALEQVMIAHQKKSDIQTTLNDKRGSISNKVPIKQQASTRSTIDQWVKPPSDQFGVSIQPAKKPETKTAAIAASKLSWGQAQVALGTQNFDSKHKSNDEIQEKYKGGGLSNSRWALAQASFDSRQVSLQHKERPPKSRRQPTSSGKLDSPQLDKPIVTSATKQAHAVLPTETWGVNTEIGRTKQPRYHVAATSDVPAEQPTICVSTDAENNSDNRLTGEIDQNQRRTANHTSAIAPEKKLANVAQIGGVADPVLCSSMYIAPHLRSTLQTKRRNLEPNQSDVAQSCGFGDLYDDITMPQSTEVYHLSPHPWSGPTTMSKKPAVFNSHGMKSVLSQANGVPRTLDEVSKKSITANKSAARSPAISVDRGILNRTVPTTTNDPTWEYSKHLTQDRDKHIYKSTPDDCEFDKTLESQGMAERGLKNLQSPPLKAVQALQQNAALENELSAKVHLDAHTNDRVHVTDNLKLSADTKIPGPFDPNKYGKPRKLNKNEHHVGKHGDGEEFLQRRPRAMGSNSRLNPSGSSTDAYSKQVEDDRTPNLKCEVYQRTSAIKHTEDDYLFGDRIGMRTWTHTPRGSVVDPIVSTRGGLETTTVNIFQADSDARQPHITLGHNKNVATKNTWAVSPDVAFCLGESNPVMQKNPNFDMAWNTTTTCVKVGPTNNQEAFNKLIMADLRTKDDTGSAPVPLTSQQLAIATGEVLDSRSNLNSFDDKISNAGVIKENIRASQGIDAAGELLDFDGSRLPAPVDWDGRKPFNNAYIAEYIKEWSQEYARARPAIDTTRLEFLEGRHPIGEHDLQAPFLHESTLGANLSEGDQVTVQPTAQDAIAKAKIKQTIRYEDEMMTAQLNAHRIRELATKAPEVDPFAPSIDIYLRPAVPNDAGGIAEVYNHYVEHTIIPEDQKVVRAQTFDRCIQNCRKNELPFIVAIRGNRPPSTDALGRLPKSSTDVTLPQHEAIVGFSFAECYNFGTAGLQCGRSRCNAVLHLYVDHRHQHKGIGRNLLDRMMHIVSDAYGHRNAVQWMNPPAKFAKIYDSSKASRWHSLYFYLPVEKQDDADYIRTSKFLNRFHFQKQCVLKSAARSSTEHGGARFIDLAIFQGTALQVDMFGPFA